MTLPPRAVLVHRHSELDELIATHGTRQHAAYFLHERGRSLDDVEARHAAERDALNTVYRAIPVDWRRGEVERGDLSRFVFGPEDIIVAVGQDGLVANVAKYLNGQVVIGVNPEPRRNPGVLVPHRPDRIPALLARATSPDVATHLQARVMVQACLDDGQHLRALNEIFVGHPSHQSARYRIQAPDGCSERQSSSGVIIATGTGSAGWCRSAWLERHSPLTLPGYEDPRLSWFVREAWPSPATDINCTEGLIEADEQLRMESESHLVIFGDGIEADSLPLTWGQQVTIRLADQRLHLLT